MKTKYFYFFLSLVVVSTLAFTVLHHRSVDVTCKIKAKQLLKFNHKLHTDIACADCHTGISESRDLQTGLFPNHDACGSCHDVGDANNCTQCHYEDKFESFTTLKHSLIFNHSSHIKEISDCETCHTGIKDDEGVDNGVLYTPPMAKCNECHSPTGRATGTCEACHSSTANLTPMNHRKGNFIKTHKFAAERNEKDCMSCHDYVSCDNCHNGTTGITENNTSSSFYRPYSPSQNINGAKQQGITRVHDLNFRYSHGVEANIKQKECTTCHETESFCVSCHESNREDFASLGVMPSSHRQTNFMLIGVGSGGGEHAVLARRDIEQCASCHDASGADPACIRCHVDNDGIKNTNPKTHNISALRDLEHGDWHSSNASVCYTCHTDPSARPNGTPGVGFCGYCHGNKKG